MDNNQNMNIDIDEVTRVVCIAAEEIHSSRKNTTPIGFVWEKDDIIAQLAKYIFHDATGEPQMRLTAMREAVPQLNIRSLYLEEFLEICSISVQRYVTQSAAARDIITQVALDPNHVSVVVTADKQHGSLLNRPLKNQDLRDMLVKARRNINDVPIGGVKF